MFYGVSIYPLTIDGLFPSCDTRHRDLLRPLQLKRLRLSIKTPKALNNDPEPEALHSRIVAQCALIHSPRGPAFCHGQALLLLLKPGLRFLREAVNTVDDINHLHYLKGILGLRTTYTYANNPDSPEPHTPGSLGPRWSITASRRCSSCRVSNLIKEKALGDTSGV